MSEIVMIPINKLYPHPDNPRKDLGDLTELSESIKANGVLQNLTVVPASLGKTPRYAPPDGTYVILIGHRRHAAARLAGLTELPCVIVEMDMREQVQTMLVENMQRSDLTVYEQAKGFQLMLDLGSTMEEISEKSGFSTSTVRRRVKWMELDQAKFKQVTEKRQISISDLDSLSQIEDLAFRNECLDKIGTRDFDMAVQKAIKHQNIGKNMPAVKAWLKSVKAKKIKDSEKWGGKYDQQGPTIYIEKWGEDGNKPEDGIESKPLFYWMDDDKGYMYGQLTLYHEREKAAPVKRTPEEISRDKAISEAWKKLEAAASLAYSLRRKFVEELTVTKKNEQQVLMGAVFAGGYNAMVYNSADRTALDKIFGIDPSEAYYISKREEKFRDGLRTISGNDWARFSWALFGDDDKQTCATGSKKEFPRYSHSTKLELICRWLTSLGYKMSTEESQILTGDHEAFKAGEEDGKV